MTRARYLCDLAAVMHVTPPVADRLRVADFAILVTGIDAYRAAAEKGGR